MSHRVHKLRVCSSENYELINNRLIRVQKVSVFLCISHQKPFIKAGKKLIPLSYKEAEFAIKDGWDVTWK